MAGRPPRFWTVSVRDTGRGIDEAVFGRIFEPFFTTRATGNGLGLATIRDIVHEHGGAINVQSIVGTGSRFEVWLPCIDGVIPMFPEDTAMPPFGHGETVLIVEEDSERLLRDEEILAALGYEPVGFTHAADVQAACLTSTERFDAVVVGNFVPAATALNLAAQLHATAPNLLILLAATSAGAFDADALIAAGISDVVSWPIAAAEIAAVLKNGLREAKDRRRPAERGTRFPEWMSAEDRAPPVTQNAGAGVGAAGTVRLSGSSRSREKLAYSSVMQQATRVPGRSPK